MRRARTPLVEQHILEREFESLLDDTLDDLYANPDPRAAIIAAYARMEQLFAARGFARDPAETSMEFLGRCVGELRASGAALGRLTGLFQRAKFSPHEVGRPMRDEAIEALTQVRDELRAHRLEDELRRAEAEQQRARHAEAQATAERDRDFSEDPFEAAAEKMRGDVYTRRALMKRVRSSSCFVVVVAVLLVAGVSFLLPGRRHIALDVFVLFLGALGLARRCARRTARAPTSTSRRSSTSSPTRSTCCPQRPAELERLEREVYLSLGSSFYLHHRLRPLLREIASNRLLVRHGVDLERRPDEAAKLLGAAGLGVAPAGPPRAARPLGAGAAARGAVRRRRRA